MHATALLRSILAQVDNDADLAIDMLKASSDAEARIARNIVRRCLSASQGATKISYRGGGVFRAEPPILQIIGVNADGTTFPLGLWDEMRHGRFNSYGLASCSQLDQIKAEMAPGAAFVRLVNEKGRCLCASGTIGSSPTAVRLDDKLPTAS